MRYTYGHYQDTQICLTARADDRMSYCTVSIWRTAYKMGVLHVHRRS